MHIYLLGYRGSGKSTVANLLSQVLNLPFIDTDDWIESASSQTIREIFESVGESGFRDKEHQVIEQVAGLPQPAVVALGGGAVLRESNRQLITDSGLRIWLRASPEHLYGCIRNDSNSGDRRPRLTDHSGFEEVVKLLAERTPIYEAVSDFIVDTDDQTPDQTVEIITNWLESRWPDCH